MQYTIVENVNRDHFTKLVQELLTDGWELYGDMIVIAPDPRERSGTRFVYVQALTKESDEQPAQSGDNS